MPTYVDLLRVTLQTILAGINNENFCEKRLKNMSPAITVKNLSVSYANGLNALTDASFAVPSASITALVGVNGAGKSTLFKALMGLVPHQNGQITILGQSVRAALAQKMIAYVHRPKPSIGLSPCWCKTW